MEWFETRENQERGRKGWAGCSGLTDSKYQQGRVTCA